jgi:NAD(P)-dependent dehydrogenase (short-subunit alcohol dehydrogenase family)
MAAFSTADLPDMSGKTVIVTGANSGIGRAAATAFANAGARVVLAVRDLAKGQATASAIGTTAATEIRELDLASLDSIRAFATAWQGEIALLINNAGVMVPPLTRTADGFELQFGTNHLGHFALYLGSRYVAQNAASGALPTLYAAVADIPGGSFAGPGFRALRGAPKLVARSAAARDAAAARRLWSVSEELTGVSFPDLHSQNKTD